MSILVANVIDSIRNMQFPALSTVASEFSLLHDRKRLQYLEIMNNV